MTNIVYVAGRGKVYPEVAEKVLVNHLFDTHGTPYFSTPEEARADMLADEGIKNAPVYRVTVELVTDVN